MPLTAFTMLLASISLLGSWFIIGQRIKSNPEGRNYQAFLMSRYFLFMGIFCLLMFAPHILLNSRPAAFPLVMAWGYTVGHIFCYIGFFYILRLTFSMVPRLSNKDNLAIALGVIVTTGLTVLNAITMIWGTQPAFDASKSVTLFNANPALGAGIAISGALTVVPAAILMLYNGFTNPTARLRSFLLGGGFIVGMIAGPLHDNATTANVYMFADLITIVGVVITTSGVLYRIDEKISVRRPVPAAAGAK